MLVYNIWNTVYVATPAVDVPNIILPKFQSPPYINVYTIGCILEYGFIPVIWYKLPILSVFIFPGK